MMGDEAHPKDTSEGLIASTSRTNAAVEAFFVS
jgi:hypothetical protein